MYFTEVKPAGIVDLWVVYFTEVKLLGDPVEIAVVEWEIELELCKVLCLLGEQHVVSGGVIAVEAVVNARCGCVCWLDDGGGQIAWQMQNDE